MQPTLPMALLVVALIGGLASQLPGAPKKPWSRKRAGHPAACGGRCNCAALGISPKAHRVVTNQPDEKQLLIANYYSGSVAVMDAATGKLQGAISLGTQPDAVRRGEILFHDAAHCFQRWNSCTSCHPNARVDGLNWDLLNDVLTTHNKLDQHGKAKALKPAEIDDLVEYLRSL